MATKRQSAGQAGTSSKVAKHRPERKCVLSNSVELADSMVRLVEGPDGTLVPDVAARLPGRGIWVSANGPDLRQAVVDGGLYKAACRSLKTKLGRGAVPEGLVDQIDHVLVRRCLDRLGLEQRAGNLVTGFEKIKAALGKKGAGDPVLIVTATDGADDGQRKIQATIGAHVPVAKMFDREALSKALGRENVVHIVLFDSGGAEKLKADISRLLSLRGFAPLTCETQGTKE